MPNNFLDALFPTRNVMWHQVSNVERRWRQIRREAGLEWVTPELFRRGVPADEPTRELHGVMLGDGVVIAFAVHGCE
jgi:hypothetical protein